MKRSLWIIEIQMNDGTWEPNSVSGVCPSQTYGRRRLKVLRKHQPGDSLRLVRYIPEAKQ